MLKITLKNGKEYTALDSTAVYPSGNPNARLSLIHIQMCIRDRYADHATTSGRAKNLSMGLNGSDLWVYYS